MVDHAVNIPGGDEKRELWLAQHSKWLHAVPVRLRNDADAVTPALEHAGDNRRTEAGVIDICIPADKDEIKLVDASRAHLLAAHGRKGILLFGHDTCILSIRSQ